MSRRLISGDTLIIATHNAGKLAEMAELLAPFGILTRSAGALQLPVPAETGHTFAENAGIKAHAAASVAGLPALADDSGLCVEALDGAPGLFSADWAGPDKNFATAIARVEYELHRRNARNLRAHFVSALVLAWPDGSEALFEGRVHGTLVFPPRGALGFGYDPIFQPDEDNRTFGEMTSLEKHGLEVALSHRARAFRLLAAACLHQPEAV